MSAVTVRRIKNMLPMAAQAYAMVCMFASTVLLTRVLGALEFGIYVAVTTLTLLLSGLGSGAQATVLARRVPVSFARGATGPSQAALIHAVFGNVLTVMLGISLAGWLAIVVFSQDGQVWGRPSELYFYCLAAIWPASVIQLNNSLRFAHNEPIMAIFPGRLLRPTWMLVASIWAYVANFGLLWLTGAYALGFFIAGGIAAAMIWTRDFRGLARPAPRFHRIRAHWAYLTPFWINSAMSAIRERGIVLVVGAAAGAVELSLFAAAQRMAGLFKTFFNISRMVFRSRFAQAFAENKPKKLERMYQSMVLQRIVLVMVPIVIVIGAEDIPVLLFGPDFADAWPVMAVLMVGVLLRLYLGAFSTVLQMANDQRWINPRTAIALVALLVGSWLGGTFFGALGAAVAGVTTTFALNMVYWRRVQVISPVRVFSRRVVMASGVLLAVGLVAAFGVQRGIEVFASDLLTPVSEAPTEGGSIR